MVMALTPLDEQVSPSQQHPAPAQLSEVHDMVSLVVLAAIQAPKMFKFGSLGWTHRLA